MSTVQINGSFTLKFSQPVNVNIDYLKAKIANEEDKPSRRRLEETDEELTPELLEALAAEFDIKYSIQSESEVTPSLERFNLTSVTDTEIQV